MHINKVTKKSYRVLQAVPRIMWIYKDFVRTRQRVGMTSTKTCFMCGHKFKDDDNLHLIITDHGNKIVCEKCNNEVLRRLNNEKQWQNEQPLDRLQEGPTD